MTLEPSSFAVGGINKAQWGWQCDCILTLWSRGLTTWPCGNGNESVRNNGCLLWTRPSSSWTYRLSLEAHGPLRAALS